MYHQLCMTSVFSWPTRLVLLHHFLIRDIHSWCVLLLREPFLSLLHNSSWVSVAFVGSGRIRQWVLCHRRWTVEKVLVFCRWVVGESNGRGGGRHVYRNLNFLVIVGARKPNSWVPERSVGLCGAHAIGHLHFLHQHFLSSGGVRTFLGFRMLNSVNLLRHLNSHNHQLTWLRLEEINFLAAWIEMTGSKFWATKADFISSECSEKFSLSSNLVRSSVNFSTFCHQEWSSPSLGSWNFSGVEAVLAQIRRFVTLNCYLRKPLLDSVHL